MPYPSAGKPITKQPKKPEGPTAPAHEDSFLFKLKNQEDVTFRRTTPQIPMQFICPTPPFIYCYNHNMKREEIEIFVHDRSDLLFTAKNLRSLFFCMFGIMGCRTFHSYLQDPNLNEILELDKNSNAVCEFGLIDEGPNNERRKHFGVTYPLYTHVVPPRQVNLVAGNHLERNFGIDLPTNRLVKVYPDMRNFQNLHYEIREGDGAGNAKKLFSIRPDKPQHIMRGNSCKDKKFNILKYEIQDAPGNPARNKKYMENLKNANCVGTIEFTNDRRDDSDPDFTLTFPKTQHDKEITVMEKLDLIGAALFVEAEFFYPPSCTSDNFE